MTPIFASNCSNLIASFRPLERLNFDIFFSAEQEWREIDSDDSRPCLLSSGLSYIF